jgi:hypothetical protein
MGVTFRMERRSNEDGVPRLLRLPASVAFFFDTSVIISG